MSTIKKMSIRGIRSFSPEREQVIEFYVPFTMIVGHNGCGKTTIIECLKYACTGSLPPGSRSGQSFIHDPKVSDVTEVKANIKMRFHNREGQNMVVIRSFSLTQKKTNLQFKALDGVIRTTTVGAGGQKDHVSMNQKCSELDKQVPILIGVSKAILENVVFCHQEEASWPMQEGAVVKKKFDDIFESTRYTKALDAIKKTKQDQAEVVKLLKIDLAELQARRAAAEGIQEDLDACQGRLSGSKEKLQELDARAAKVQDQLEECQDLADKVSVAEATKHSLEQALRDLDVGIREKKGNMHVVLEESDEELREKIEEWDNGMAKWAEDLDQRENACQELENDIRQCKREKDRATANQGALEAKLQNQRRLLAEQDSVVGRLAAKHGRVDPAGRGGGSSSAGAGAGSAGEEGALSVSRADVEQMRKTLKTKLAETKTRLQELRAQSRSEEDGLQSEITKLQLDQRSASAAVTTKEKEQATVQAELKALKQSAQSSGGGSQSQSGVASLERDLAKAERAAESAQEEFSQFETTNRTSTVEREIKDIESRQTSLKPEVDRLEELVRDLGKHAEDERDLAVREAQIGDDVTRLEDSIRQEEELPLEQPLGSGEAAALEAAAEELRGKASEAEKARSDKDRDAVDVQRGVTEQETMLAQRRRDGAKVEKRLSDLQTGPMREVGAVLEKHNDEFGSTYGLESDPAEVLQAFKDRESSSSTEKVWHEHQIKFVQKLLASAQKAHSTGGKAKCPVCVRTMEEQEYATFLESNNQLCQAIQGNINDAGVGETLVRAKEQCQKLEGLEQEWREYQRLRPQAQTLTDDVLRIQGEAEGLRERLAKERKELEELRAYSLSLSAGLHKVQRFLEESNRIGGRREEAKRIKGKLQRHVGRGESLSEAQEKLRAMADKKESMEQDLQAKNRELQRLTQRQLTLTNVRNGVEADLKEARDRLARRKEFDERCTALKQREEVLGSEIASLRAMAAPLRQQLAEKEGQLNRKRTQARESVDLGQATANEIADDANQLERVAAAAEESLKSNLGEELVRARKALADLERQIQEKEAELGEARHEIQQKRGEYQASERHKKNIQDNLELRGMTKEREEKHKDAEAVAEEIAGMGAEGVNERMRQLQRETSQLSIKRGEIMGRLATLKEQVREHETKLRQDTYKDVYEKHRRKMIEHRTTEMAVQDLDKYWYALDKALLRYHTLKISEINKIIRELWTSTYMGQDIDMIKIVSGDEGESASKAKRSYNYRVVMYKNGTELDMKGRCSAGQRVLASIVIRLALAETFCVSCGILALDEPTTNLDHDNKQSLAAALSRIIGSRSAQNNFQIVVITHDEDFVQIMRTDMSAQTGVSMPDYYWRVSREELAGKFYSKIERHTWDTLS